MGVKKVGSSEEFEFTIKPYKAPPAERWYPGYLLDKIREIIGRGT